VQACSRAVDEQPSGRRRRLGQAEGSVGVSARQREASAVRTQGSGGVSRARPRRAWQGEWFGACAVRGAPVRVTASGGAGRPSALRSHSGPVADADSRSLDADSPFASR
jgi:hypothetical protein